MSKSNYTVLIYDKPDGSYPVKEFLGSLDIHLKGKMLLAIHLAEHYGPLVREPYSKPLAKGIFEFRGRYGTNSARILYFFYSGRQIILTNGFIKKSQNTPRREIEIAIDAKAEYEARKGN